MSDKIYFNTSAKFSVKRSLLNLTTRLHHTVAPKHAKKTARKLLLTPVRSKPKNTEPEGLVKGKVDWPGGELKTYTLGCGPIWVLSHGWSGTASQFFPLMEHIAGRGYTALAYDHPAHGNSDGAYGHIPAFVRGLEAILDSFDEELAGLIAHSMGTASSLECRHRKVQQCPMILIAPVLDYLDNLFGSVARSGYSMRLFEEVVSEIEDQYHYPLQSIDPFKKLGLRESKTIIVHDEKDKFADFSVSVRADTEYKNVTLRATKGQGHGRVMTSQEVLDSFDSLMK
ncbi:alpha/beta fold hydrolase [Vibrio sp. ZSDE26]|uniref:Alpha/beta fold hydrolase n=1 Tax=Vibrio amylolyticus TaxID=2847292 RepID=A0A9X2BLW7_9VIBR|nr:alpha/beta fold hydrolase [Vibrio amylolyticus]MCK6264353.1 alpha/beta fold hydrolase [Vibrio amylolyticus]